MQQPLLIKSAYPRGLFPRVLHAISPYLKQKSESNPTYRALLGEQGVSWCYSRGPEVVEAELWPDFIKKLSTMALDANSCTAYLYKPQGYVRAHSDYRYMLNVESEHFSIASFGGTRTLKFSNGTQYALHDGDLLHVHRDFDMQHLHWIDPEHGSSDRISLTFRRMS